MFLIIPIIPAINTSPLVHQQPETATDNLSNLELGKIMNPPLKKKKKELRGESSKKKKKRLLWKLYHSYDVAS